MPDYEDVILESHDKLKIKAYLIRQGASTPGEAGDAEAKKRPTILFLHANAGNMVNYFFELLEVCAVSGGACRLMKVNCGVSQGHRLPFAHIFFEKFKCNVFMLSYRGSV